MRSGTCNAIPALTGAKRRARIKYWAAAMNIRIPLGAVALLSSTQIPAQPRGDAPVAVPRTIRQGIVLVHVDPRMNSVARRRQRPQNWLQRYAALNRRRGVDRVRLIRCSWI